MGQTHVISSSSNSVCAWGLCLNDLTPDKSTTTRYLLIIYAIANPIRGQIIIETTWKGKHTNMFAKSKTQTIDRLLGKDGKQPWSSNMCTRNFLQGEYKLEGHMPVKKTYQAKYY